MHHSNHSSDFLRFLRWFCPPSLYEGIEGDLLEQYEADAEVLGEKKAKWRLLWNVLRFFRPGILMRNTFENRIKNTGMLQNYLTMAWRNILRHPAHTTLNVVGLALGLASCFLIGLYVRYELSFDHFHTKAEHIYRYIPQFAKDGQMTLQAQTAAGIAPHLLATVPEIDQVVRYTEWEAEPYLKWKENELPIASISLADSDFFDMFSFTLLQGDPSTVLLRPMTVVVSKTIANTVFGTESPIGQILIYNSDLQLEVTGVFEDVPAASHLQFSYLLSVASLPGLYETDQSALTDMYNWNFSTYLFAPSIVDFDQFDQNVTASMVNKMKNAGFGDGEAAASHWLQPLNEIHFTQGIRGDGPTSNLSNVYIFAAVAIFIILIACFNFMNLSTARAIGRAKEVGVRKVMGAVRKQLIIQFLSEAFLIVLLAGALGLLLFWMVVPWFNHAIGLKLAFDIANDWQFFVLLLAVIVATALVAGSYPAFYLSSFTPTMTLRGSKASGGKTGLRNVLTVIQFSLSVFLLIGTLVISRQLSYMQEAELGYDKELVVHFPLPDELQGERFETLKRALLTYHGIDAVSRGSDVPGSITGHNIFEIQTGDGEKRIEPLTNITIDYDYVDALGIELVDGRDFSEDFTTDETQGYLVNETLVKFFGLNELPGGAIGTPMKWMNSEYPEGSIVGVVKDFHARSLQNKIEPIVIWFSEWEPVGIVKLNGNDVSGSLAVLEKEWRELAGRYPLSYTFLDDSLARTYLAEEKTMTLAGSFSILAIVISCMGLIGLVSYMAEQRKKEIGIRKVLGASVATIVSLFSWRFIRLVVFASAVTVPVAVLAVDEWLSNFAYKVDLQWWAYGIPVAAVLVITIFVSSGFTVKAAKTNPVDCLRYE